MRLAIMQPYFFPYIGYFSLIRNTDQFILLDTIQFIRHGWIERNRILNQQEGWIYFKVPLIKENGRSTLINEIRIDNHQNWKQKIIAQMQSYKKIAPYYNNVMEMLNELFSHEFNDMVSLNKASLEKVFNFLGLDIHVQVFSGMNLNIEQPKERDEWALNICKAIGGVNEYWNPPGGQTFFDRQKYLKAGIDIKFMTQIIAPYSQHRPTFEPRLSIIDIMMFNDIDVIYKMMENYELS